MSDQSAQVLATQEARTAAFFAQVNQENARIQAAHQRSVDEQIRSEMTRRLQAVTVANPRTASGNLAEAVARGNYGEACAMMTTQTTAQTEGRTQPEASLGNLRNQLLQRMKAAQGTPYGHPPANQQTPGSGGHFDCSGFVVWAFRNVGITFNLSGLTGSLATQIVNSPGVTQVSRPVPGDLVYWTSPSIHIMVYSDYEMAFGASKPGINIQERAVRLFGIPTYYRVGGLDAQ